MAATDVVVRPVERTDRVGWAALWAGYNAFYERTGPTEVLPETTARTWDRFFDAHEPMFALVAERDGRLLGLAHCVLHRNTTMFQPICYLQDLFTAAEARGAGVGRALIAAVYDRARSLGCSRVYWQTHEDNRVARRLYDGVAVRTGHIVYRHDLG